MATKHTLTGNIFDLAGATFGSKAISLHVVTNLGQGALVDKTTNAIHLGGKIADVNESTGEFTVDLIDTSATDLNVPAGEAQYEVRATYIDAGTRQRQTWYSGWFGLTADANLADITTDVSPLAVSSASTYALEAKAYRDEAEVITGLTGEDDAVALLVNTPGSDTAGALSATIGAEVAPIEAELATLPANYARRGLTLFAGLKRALEAGLSTGVQVLGDSTGNESFEWPRLLADDLAAAHPSHTVQQLLWSDTTQDFVRTTIQTGTAGARYMDTTGATNSDRLSQSVSLTGTLDIRVKVRAPDYTPAASKMLVGAMSTGKRSWALCINTGGVPQIVYSTDGTAIATMSATAALDTTDDTDTWIRAVFIPNDGGGNRVAKFYKSTDGETWTQVGTTVTTVGAVTLYDPGTTDFFRLGGTTVGAYGYWVGRIYEVQIRSGEGGGTVAPCLPDQWYSAGSSAPVVGAPVLTLVNGSHPGAGLAYLNDATRLPKMTPHYAQSLVFLSDSHNESNRIGPTFLSQYDAWVNAVKARHILPIVVLTQNPQQAAASASVPHSARRADLLAYAPGKGLGVIDTYAAFLANPSWSAQWMADTVHPNALGQAAWYDAIEAEFDPI